MGWAGDGACGLGSPISSGTPPAAAQPISNSSRNMGRAGMQTAWEPNLLHETSPKLPARLIRHVHTLPEPSYGLHHIGAIYRSSGPGLLCRRAVSQAAQK